MRQTIAIRKISTMGKNKIILIPKSMLPLEGDYVKIAYRDGKIVITNIQKESA